MCLTSPATVVRVGERGGICVVTVTTADEGERECLTYVDGLEPGDRVLVAGGAIVEKSEDLPDEAFSLTAALLEAFDATHDPGGTK